MREVRVEISMSLDGYGAGPRVAVDAPMGEGGERLHDWLFEASSGSVDAEVEQEMVATTGAVVVGRRTFDCGVGLWGDTPFPAPTFVLTHEDRDELVMESGTFSFVTDGIESAVRQARAAAGDRDVTVMGGADVVRQALRAGLVDELRLHLAHVLLGAGTSLFDGLGAEHIGFERTAVLESPRATHLRLRPVVPR
jgi:dihydrofolate reductase